MILKLAAEEANLTPELKKKVDGSTKKAQWYAKFNADYVNARKLYDKTVAAIDTVPPEKAPETYNAMKKMEADLLATEKQLYGIINEPYIQEDVYVPSTIKDAITKASFISRQGSVIFRGTKLSTRKYSEDQRK